MDSSKWSKSEDTKVKLRENQRPEFEDFLSSSPVFWGTKQAKTRGREFGGFVRYFELRNMYLL